MGKKIVISIFIVGVFSGLFFLGNYWNNIIHARFNVHALGRYIHAYDVIEGRLITSFSELPDFHLVSPNNSLSLKSSDLKLRILKGYLYNFQSEGKNGFVVSASPLNAFSPEFGMTEDLNLRVNFHQVDAESDSYDEVRQWTVMPEWFMLRTELESS